MVECVIDSVRVSLTNQQRIVVLRESDQERYLAIWIGPFEAEAITVALQEIEVARPQTHDLLRNTLRTLGARLLRVEITALRDDVYFANLIIETGDTQYTVDSRSSDALALAVRCHVPILVDMDVLETAGITPDRDIQSQSEGEDEAEGSISSGKKAGTGPGEDRLSVFEDFLENLDIGNETKDAPDDPENPEVPPPPDEPGPEKS
jgi:bifunctional DNase/RNase